jgi:hypothetical protein
MGPGAGRLIFSWIKRASAWMALWLMIPALMPLSGNAIGRASCPDVGFTIVEARPSGETRALQIGGNRTIYVHQVPITTTSDITDIQWRRDDGDDASLLIRFTPAGTQRLHDATTDHSGRRIAFLYNDEVLVDVLWEGRFGTDADGAQISLRHGLKKAQEVVKTIQGCTATARR